MIITLIVVILMVFGGIIALVIGFAVGVFAQRSLEVKEREKRVNEATKRIWAGVEPKIKKEKVN